MKEQINLAESNVSLRHMVPDFLDVEITEDQVSMKTFENVITFPKSVYRDVITIHEQVSGRSFDISGLSKRQVSLLPIMKQNSLLFELDEKSSTMTGREFYQKHYLKHIDTWLDYAFSHSSWQNMLDGKENKNVFIGWLFELFHYTKNANRHMPLSVAYCKNKKVKTLLAEHYKEEWSHYHYFRSALQPLGYSRDEVDQSAALPMTEEMSNFMRQAARDDVLCYAICSAILEGTTIDNTTYDSFYAVVKEKYDLPQSAIQPIYDHLELDAKYGHANLFEEICDSIGEISNERAEKALTYGKSMAEHILLWSENIASYYSSSVRIPRSVPGVFDV